MSSASPETGGAELLDELRPMYLALGAGLGERLLQQAWDHAEAQELRLVVVATNADALRFYERLGFEPFVTTLRLDGRPQREES